MSTSILVPIYLAIALAGSGLPIIKIFLAHFHNLVSLVICACLEGGRGIKIQLLRDGSGQTTGAIASPFKKALISYAGYTAVSVTAIGLFYLVARGSYHLVIYLSLGWTILALVLWIRNLFGVFWGLSVAVILALPVYLRCQMAMPAQIRYELVFPFHINYELVFVHMSIFLASVLFIQSIICAVRVCKQMFMSRTNPARKAALVQTKFVPAIVLGLALLSQTIYAGYFFVQNFISIPFRF
ncbi:M50 family metallopeptidase [Neobacillus muris]|uniref:M50 family metallopeptidase n=1 Tax=Neobacillus muris TaxID=2941334 RepID=UPI00203A3A04|nr:M50 family metallopeptidase [Neobacillus muris]